MGYAAYPELKDAGVPWMAQIPSHWELMRLKNIASHNDDTLDESTEPDFELEYVDISSVSLEEGITQSEIVTFEKAPSRARRRVRDGDTIVSTVRTYLKAIAPIEASPENLTVSTGFAVIRPQAGIHSRYLAYYLQSNGFVGNIVANSTGVSYPAINASDLVRLPAIKPPLAEQQAIARFLDHKTAQIDTLIAKKEALLQKLAEKRTALISHAVTKGLDPSLPMKDSGVAWLGRIPAHWQLKQLRHIGKCIIGLTYAPPDVVDDESGTLVLRSSNIQGGRICFYDNVYVSSPIPDELRTKIGDILICARNGSRSLIGKNAIITEETASMTFGAFMTIFRCDAPEFVHRIFNSTLFSYQSSACLTSTINQLTIGHLNSMVVPWPPEKEQDQICEFLSSNLKKLDELPVKVEQALSNLREYRSALITAAVTGKIDVRHVPVPEAARP